jgi:hypothetical protein
MGIKAIDVTTNVFSKGEVVSSILTGSTRSILTGSTRTPNKIKHICRRSGRTNCALENLYPSCTHAAAKAARRQGARSCQRGADYGVQPASLSRRRPSRPTGHHDHGRWVGRGDRDPLECDLVQKIFRFSAMAFGVAASSAISHA